MCCQPTELIWGFFCFIFFQFYSPQAAGLAMEDEEPAAVEEEEDSGKKKYRFGGIDDADCGMYG